MPVKLQDFLKTAILLFLFTLIAYFAKRFGDVNEGAAAIFILAVVLVSRMTHGYVWGILASVYGVLAANFIFSDPYGGLDFTRHGYPVTYGVLLAATIIISLLFHRYKKRRVSAEETGRKLQETYLNQRQLERNNEKDNMKNHLLRTITQDMQTPLGRIQDTAAAIYEGGDRMDLRSRNKLLEDIAGETEWLIRMMENLVSVTQISDDTMEVRKKPEIAEEVIAAAVSLVSSTNIPQTVTVRVPDDLIIVPMDATLIRQVLLNLLDNASRHAGEGSEIEVSLTTDEQNAIFSVSDNGRGIPEQELQSLFEYGVTKNKADQEVDTRGFGIGLPTCKTIILAHEGNLWAENNPDCGSCFRFSLPL